jgi:hypothetical protein
MRREVANSAVRLMPPGFRAYRKQHFYRGSAFPCPYSFRLQFPLPSFALGDFEVAK